LFETFLFNLSLALHTKEPLSFHSKKEKESKHCANIADTKTSKCEKTIEDASAAYAIYDNIID